MENKFANMEDWLDDLNKGRISEAAFNKKMEEAGVTDYKALAETHKAAINVIQRYNILQQVSAVHKDYTAVHSPEQKNKSGAVRVLKPLLRIAAVFLLVTASISIYFVSTTSQSTVYNTLTQEYHAETNRADEGTETSAMVSLFNNKNFEAVVTEFEKLTKPSVREKFLGGYAYLQTGKYEKASSNFKQILEYNKNSGERLYQDEAEYYITLSLIQSKKYEDAYKYAEGIYNQSYHTYHSKITYWLLLKLKWLS